MKATFLYVHMGSDSGEQGYDMERAYDITLNMSR